jgi:hypothetical protein
LLASLYGAAYGANTPTGRTRAMILDLTQDDTRMLRQLLEDYLPEIKREVARTDVKTLRHELVLRQELVERLVERLAKA